MRLVSRSRARTLSTVAGLLIVVADGRVVPLVTIRAWQEAECSCGSSLKDRSAGRHLLLRTSHFAHSRSEEMENIMHSPRSQTVRKNPYRLQVEPLEDRTVPTDLAYQNGVNLDYMVKLASELNADAWHSMPHMADDDYVRESAKYVLEPTRTVQVVVVIVKAP